MTDVAKDIETLLAPAVAAGGLELVDVEWRRESVGWVLRLYLDKPGGFSLEDCASWNDRLGEAVDASGLIGHPYSLEVSSPGLNRPLKKREDFQRHVGIGCILKTREPINNQRNYRGTIASLEGDTLMLVDRTSGLVGIPLAQVQSAKLDPDT